MQFWDFLRKNCISIRQKFVRHLLKIRSFDELKISKYTGCAKEGSTKVFLKSVLKPFRDKSRTDATSKKERFVLIINGHLYIINTNSCQTAYTIALKTGTCFGKKRDFLQDNN